MPTAERAEARKRTKIRQLSKQPQNACQQKIFSEYYSAHGLKYLVQLHSAKLTMKNFTIRVQYQPMCLGFKREETKCHALHAHTHTHAQTCSYIRFLLYAKMYISSGNPIHFELLIQCDGWWHLNFVGRATVRKLQLHHRI